MTPVLAEFIGTAVMLLLGTGVCANVSLARTKGNGAGWIVVIVTWAMAVFTGVMIAGPYSGAHLNPSVTLAFAATGQFPWSDVPGYVLAQMLGGAAGALATWLFYRPHFDLEENPDTIRGVFCTAPAVRNPASNLLSEIIATFVLIFTIFYITEGHLSSTEGNVPIGLGSVGALPVALVILVIGGALGGTTGYSLNPARDLSPRIVHALVPIRHKGGSDWRYAWIASVGPLLGALLAAGVQVMIRS